MRNEATVNAAKAAAKRLRDAIKSPQSTFEELIEGIEELQRTCQGDEALLSWCNQRVTKGLQ